MKTEVAVEKLIEICPCIVEVSRAIKTDEEFKTILLQRKEMSNVEFLFSVIPLLLKNYKTPIFKVVAIMSDKTVEEIYEQDSSKTISEIVKLFSDKDIGDFIQSFVGQTPKAIS